NREFGSEYVGLLYRFSDALTNTLTKLCSILSDLGHNEDARLCLLASKGEPTGIPALDECARFYLTVACGLSNDIAGSIAGCVLSRDYFAALDAQSTGAALCALCLRLCWLSLAPDILACDSLAKQAFLDFDAFLKSSKMEKREALKAQLIELLKSTGGIL
ncbi:MAG TPA: hypothetical protein PLH38_07725, partial [Clostridia bacterium]|nr:hypothetical protein [Clostridia bacterium]